MKEGNIVARILSTFAIAKMLRVDPGSVVNWIEQNKLKAHRTPGGHRRIEIEDLLQFLHDQKMPIPKELQSAPARILVVDDEPAVTQLIVKAIQAAHPDFELVEAHDGFAAGTIVATLKPDVVVLDLRMPGMDGYEVCRVIKSHEQTRHAEVLAITAYPSPKNEERILQCGARLCLTKPLDMQALLREIETVLRENTTHPKKKKT